MKFFNAYGMRYAAGMEVQLVIARAYRNRPLKRLLLETVNDRGFICHPDTLEDYKNGNSYPVGFPLIDLFHFNEQLFARLESAFRRRDKRAIANIWTECRPFGNEDD
jgi:hypothetical protein